MKRKIAMLLLCVSVLLTGAIVWAEAEKQDAKISYRDVAANLSTNGTRTASGGTTPTVMTNTDTALAIFELRFNSDAVIRDSIIKTSGYPRGSAKLQGTNDTLGRWWTVRGVTNSPVYGATDSVYTWSGNTNFVGVWYIQKFPFRYGRILHQTDTTEVITTKVRVTGTF